MTHKEILNLVKGKLLAQNAKSKDRITCMYRGFNNTKCAIGWLIPDSEYDQDIEGVPVKDIDLYPYYGEDIKLKKCIEVGIGRPIDQQDIFFLTKLQNIHDRCDVSEWEHEFNRLEEKL